MLGTGNRGITWSTGTRRRKCNRTAKIIPKIFSVIFFGRINTQIYAYTHIFLKPQTIVLTNLNEFLVWIFSSWFKF
jgi:hypothetical protein